MRDKLLQIVVVLLLMPATAAVAAAPVRLPVYIEDSHAGTYYWLIENLSLQRDYQLVQIDAHSDASEILGSDAIRNAVMNSAGAGQLDSLVQSWRQQGKIQSFNWIEPLMPHPVTKTWWVPAESLSSAEITKKQEEVQREINAHQEVSPRQSGELGDRYEIVDLHRFLELKIDQPVIVSIDLDYFAGMSDAAEMRTTLSRILDHVLEFRNLQAITFAISRPFQGSDAEANLLLYEALRYLTRIVNADITFEPFASTGADRSERAKDLYRRRLRVPSYEVAGASAALRSLLLQNAARITVNKDRDRWRHLLEQWQNAITLPSIGLEVDQSPPESGREFIVAANHAFKLVVENHGNWPQSKFRWHVLTAEHTVYNLTEGDQGYADGAPKYIVYRDDVVSADNATGELDGAKLLPFLDKATGLGTVRLFCEIRSGDDIYLSELTRLSRYEGTGYIGKLTEIFNLPYVYGSGLLNDEGKISADARQGADCSHFIIYGRRRSGAEIPYADPKELLPYLRQVDEFKFLENGIAYGRNGPIAIPADLWERGLLLFLGKHVAAVYQEPGKASVLNAKTLIVHQLEGPPEITMFGAIVAKYKRIRVMTFR